uniref:TERF1-interacting nuclear factor 2 N-terminal domain-containing protein n=1 Tax=Hucho hucho TaxID=62062 RepID=A0A4W5L7L2_9TELE
RCSLTQDLVRITAHLFKWLFPQFCCAETEASKSNFLALVQTLIQDPVEREHFFQEVFPVDYGPKYDSALQGLMWEFLSGLEQLLPVPDLKQVLMQNLVIRPLLGPPLSSMSL